MSPLRALCALVLAMCAVHGAGDAVPVRAAVLVALERLAQHLLSAHQHAVTLNSLISATGLKAPAAVIKRLRSMVVQQHIRAATVADWLVDVSHTHAEAAADGKVLSRLKAFAAEALPIGPNSGIGALSIDEAGWGLADLIGVMRRPEVTPSAAPAALDGAPAQAVPVVSGASDKFTDPDEVLHALATWYHRYAPTKTVDPKRLWAAVTASSEGVDGSAATVPPMPTAPAAVRMPLSEAFMLMRWYGATDAAVVACTSIEAGAAASSPSTSPVPSPATPPPLEGEDGSAAPANDASEGRQLEASEAGSAVDVTAGDESAASDPAPTLPAPSAVSTPQPEAPAWRPEYPFADLAPAPDAVVPRAVRAHPLFYAAAVAGFVEGVPQPDGWTAPGCTSASCHISPEVHAAWKEESAALAARRLAAAARGDNLPYPDASASSSVGRPLPVWVNATEVTLARRQRAADWEAMRALAEKMPLAIADAHNGTDGGRRRTVEAATTPTDPILFLQQEAVRRAFLHAYGAYEDVAFGSDILQPLSGRGSSDLCKLGMSLLDALDTALVMGLPGPYERARAWVADAFPLQWGNGEQADINLFETTIRVVGGLLAAWDLTGDTLFARRAHEVASMLARTGAFDSPSGIPFGTLTVYGPATRAVLAPLAKAELESKGWSNGPPLSLPLALTDSVAPSIPGIGHRGIGGAGHAYNPQWLNGAASLAEAATLSVELLTLATAVEEAAGGRAALTKGTAGDEGEEEGGDQRPLLYPAFEWSQLLQALQDDASSTDVAVAASGEAEAASSSSPLDAPPSVGWWSHWYARTAHRVMGAVAHAVDVQASSPSSNLGGLLPIYIDSLSGSVRTDAPVTLGARGDSTYEYWLKTWVAAGGWEWEREHVHRLTIAATAAVEEAGAAAIGDAAAAEAAAARRQFGEAAAATWRSEAAAIGRTDPGYLLRNYNRAVSSIASRLAARSLPSSYLYVNELIPTPGSNGGSASASPKMDHLVCFLPGTLALGVTHGAGHEALTAWVGARVRRSALLEALAAVLEAEHGVSDNSEGGSSECASGVLLPPHLAAYADQPCLSRDYSTGRLQLPPRLVLAVADAMAGRFMSPSSSRADGSSGADNDTAVDAAAATVTSTPVPGTEDPNAPPPLPPASAPASPSPSPSLPEPRRTWDADNAEVDAWWWVRDWGAPAEVLEDAEKEAAGPPPAGRPAHLASYRLPPETPLFSALVADAQPGGLHIPVAILNAAAEQVPLPRTATHRAPTLVRDAGALFDARFPGIRDPLTAATTLLGAAHQLCKTCAAMYERTSTGLAPEIITFKGGSDFAPNEDARHSLLRPETVESLFLMQRITRGGVPEYRRWGWAFFDSLERHARVRGGGYASVRNVQAWPLSDGDPTDGEGPSGRKPGFTHGRANMMDKQESFFLAETLKYLYLLFSDDGSSTSSSSGVSDGEGPPPSTPLVRAGPRPSVRSGVAPFVDPEDGTFLPLDAWVFNTEAHPVRRRDTLGSPIGPAQD